MPFHRKAFLFLVYIPILSMVCYYSCRKMDHAEPIENADPITQRFFMRSSRGEPIVRAIAANIERQNAKAGFIQDLSARAGFPIWEKAKVRQESDHLPASRNLPNAGSNSIIIIPFSKDSAEFITALLIAWINGNDTTFKLIHHWQYLDYSLTPRMDGYWDAHDVLNAFAYFEETIYNHTRFLILDTNLVHPVLGARAAAITRGQTSSNYNARLIAVEECTDYMVCYYYPEIGEPTHGGYVRTATGPSPGLLDCNEWTECNTYYYGAGGGFPSSGQSAPTPTNPTPPHNGGGGAWYSNPCTPSLNSPCAGSAGWTPIPTLYPVLDEPIDTLLKKYAEAVNSIADSMMALSLANPQREYVGAIVMKDGNIYVKNIKTDGDSSYSIPNFNLAPGEILLGAIHTHPRVAILDRSAPSNGDIAGMKLSLNFVHFIECGNVRYALVMEDVTKARNFYKQQTPQGMFEFLINTAYQQSNWFSNWQGATQVAVINLLGSASINGIGFYVSNNSRKTAFTKLNP